jgi:hypothetical protein
MNLGGTFTIKDLLDPERETMEETPSKQAYLVRKKNCSSSCEAYLGVQESLTCIVD